MNRLIAYLRTVLWWNVAALAAIALALVAAVLALVWLPGLGVLAIVLAISSLAFIVLGLQSR